MNGLAILFFVATWTLLIISIIHIWKRQTLSKGVKIAWTVFVFLSSWIGLVIYWICYNKGKSDSGTKGSEPYQEMLKLYDELPQQHEGKELVKNYFRLFPAFMVNPDITYDEKCKLIELHEERISQHFESEDFLEKVTYYMGALAVCYKMLDDMFGGNSLIIASDAADYEAAVKGHGKKLQSMSVYLGQIMTYAALLSSPNGEAEFDSGIFDNYKIPNWMEGFGE